MDAVSSATKSLHAGRRQVTLRRAHVADAATVVDIAFRAYATISALVPYPSLTEKDVAAFLTRPNAGAYIASNDGRAVGTVSFIHDCQVLQLFRLGVLRSHRRRGVGEMLVGAVESYAKRRHVAIVFLQTAAELHLVPYYERLGYQVQGQEIDNAGGVEITRIDLFRMI
ncbi:MAG: GNAT family N-acetyltransferase [Candidatus Eremiobacteraeota bacterium]|nr:GNAT family N-acetyltransferase [Candidatus Eremiobacteraeota bacterium]MBC5826867.1 GNAT family N-acetyltransferase [Candidatus Eremiobacteraeota bacterium]